MTYYINPIWFYLVNTLNSLRIILVVIASITFGGVLIGAFIWVCNTYVDYKENKKALVTLGKAVIIAIALLLISCLIPSKETYIEMMIASQVTHENVDASREEVYNIIDYVTDKMSRKESEEE